MIIQGNPVSEMMCPKLMEMLREHGVVYLHKSAEGDGWIASPRKAPDDPFSPETITLRVGKPSVGPAEPQERVDKATGNAVINLYGAIEAYRPTLCPALNGPYAEMLISLAYCATCKTPMMPVRERPRWKPDWPFPVYERINLAAQLRAAGWRMGSGAVDKEQHEICVECAATGRSSFVCALCKTERSTTEIQESFGDPPEHLCKPCYATVPAQTWEAKVAALEKAHRWDFE